MASLELDTEGKAAQALRKAAEYIGKVQPQLDQLPAFVAKAKEQSEKLASAATVRADFVKRATSAADALVREGVLDPSERSAFVDGVSERPSRVFDLVEKLAAARSRYTGLGSASHVPAVGTQDPWEREFFGHISDSGVLD